MGEALNESGRPEDAVAAYQEVMQRAPHHSEARLVLSHILHGLGRREQAISVLSQGRPGTEWRERPLEEAPVLPYGYFLTYQVLGWE